MSMNKVTINAVGIISVYITNSGEMTIADVKRWIDKVDELGIPDDTALDNCSLKLSYRAPVVSRISCKDCLPDDVHTGFSVFGENCQIHEKKDQ